MNLFRRAGKKFEETKQSFMSGREADYVCRSCEESLSEDSRQCPHCGEETVEPVQ